MWAGTDGKDEVDIPENKLNADQVERLYGLSGPRSRSSTDDARRVRHEQRIRWAAFGWTVP
jgi:hypothetical protein